MARIISGSYNDGDGEVLSRETEKRWYCYHILVIVRIYLQGTMVNGPGVDPCKRGPLLGRLNNANNIPRASTSDRKNRDRMLR